MDNLSLDDEIDFDPKLDSLLDDKLLGLDDGEAFGEVHGNIVPALDDQAEGLEDNLAGVVGIHNHGATPCSS